MAVESMLSCMGSEGGGRHYSHCACLAKEVLPYWTAPGCAVRGCMHGNCIDILYKYTSSFRILYIARAAAPGALALATLLYRLQGTQGTGHPPGPCVCTSPQRATAALRTLGESGVEGTQAPLPPRQGGCRV